MNRIVPAGPLAGVNIKRSRVVDPDRRVSYRRWAAMQHRCLQPASKSYPDYGGRGIKVCDRWNDFDLFYQDMGNPPKGMWLDRIDNEGPYSPDNCRWVTPMESAENRRSSKRIVINGKPYSVRELEAISGLPYQTISSRLKNGWSPERLLQPKIPSTATKNLGASNGRTKLNDTDVERIRDMRKHRVKLLTIAAHFGISRDYVISIAKGRTRNEATAN